ncbi:MAG TPA: ABC transporter permease [Cytophagales bacterium]|nr:ABC transporter permease [Cytophagales bacterium]HAP59112.1 ABC transporter permease [Cytophagales bacterium]
MAWRDARRNFGRLLLFLSSIVLGVAALVAISSFGDNLRQDIQEQSKNLLGADLRITTSQKVTDSVHSWYDTLGVARAWESNFASMVYFPKTEDTRLVQIRALEGDFPFYGKMETDPPNVSQLLKSSQVAIVDRALMEQFGAKVGDSIRVGTLGFRVIGMLDKVPGANEVVSMVAAPVYIPRRYLAETGLMRLGSQVRTNLYFKLPDQINADTLKDVLYDEYSEQGWGFETVTDRQNSLGNTFSGLTRFLNLVAFVALLLGCIGVASSVHIYIKEKINSVAILRTMGAQARHGVWIFLVQIAVVGMVGSLMGVLLGMAVQFYLPEVLAPFLPFEVTIRFSDYSIAQGILTGLAMAILFALFPLLSVRKVAPLRVLRAGMEGEKSPRDWAQLWVAVGVLLFVWGFAYWQIREWLESLLFTAFMLGGFLILAGAARLLMWSVRKFFPHGWRFTLRQGLANLYRPQNQTTILLASIGLGTTLIATLTLTQNMLLDEVAINSGENQANMVLFDIQPTQIEDVREIMGNHAVTPMEEMPVVAVRFHRIKGLTVDTLLQDTTIQFSRQRLIREQRVSYREDLIEGEEIIAGAWTGNRERKQDSVFVSLDQEYAERLHLQLGDELIFNVQGIKLKTYVGSLREIDWDGMRTNFSIVFPAGVLEKAPQFFISMVRTESPEQTAAFRKSMVQFFPTVSIIDLGTILKTLDEVLSQITFVVQFMAMFSILTGVLVLIGSVSISKYQQIRESVLLRTIGGSRKQIVQITLLEYFFLGSLSSISGILLALIASGLLARYSFEIPFSPNLLDLVIIYLGITLLTVGIGAFNLRGVVKKPPLAVLRENL